MLIWVEPGGQSKVYLILANKRTRNNIFASRVQQLLKENIFTRVFSGLFSVLGIIYFRWTLCRVIKDLVAHVFISYESCV